MFQRRFGVHINYGHAVSFPCFSAVSLMQHNYCKPSFASRVDSVIAFGGRRDSYGMLCQLQSAASPKTEMCRIFHDVTAERNTKIRCKAARILSWYQLLM